MRDNALLRIANNWVHDFASGLWGACVVVIYLLDSQMATAAAAAEPSLRQTGDLFWMVLLVSLGLIVVTGAVRLVYWRAATPAEELPAKRPALIWKHVAYLVVYGIGTLYAWALVRSMAAV